MKYPKPKPSGTTRTIDDVEYTFYPARWRLFESLRTHGQDVLYALTTLRSQQADSRGTRVERIERDGEVQVVQTMDSIPLEVLINQRKDAEDATASLLNALQSEKTQRLVEQLIADSLRMDGTPEEIHDWFSDVPVPTVIKMLVAWMEAQAEGPFLQQARDLLGVVREYLSTQMTGALKALSSEIAGGSGSKTPSPDSSLEATPDPM